jgi:hypothetical protein
MFIFLKIFISPPVKHFLPADAFTKNRRRGVKNAAGFITGWLPKLLLVLTKTAAHQA